MSRRFFSRFLMFPVCICVPHVVHCDSIRSTLSGIQLWLHCVGICGWKAQWHRPRRSNSRQVLRRRIVVSRSRAWMLAWWRQRRRFGCCSDMKTSAKSKNIFIRLGCIAKVAKAMERERERGRDRARAREPKSPDPELQVLQKMKQRRLASFSPSRRVRGLNLQGWTPVSCSGQCGCMCSKRWGYNFLADGRQRFPYWRRTVRFPCVGMWLMWRRAWPTYFYIFRASTPKHSCATATLQLSNILPHTAIEATFLYSSMMFPMIFPWKHPFCSGPPLQSDIAPIFAALSHHSISLRARQSRRRIRWCEPPYTRCALIRTAGKQSHFLDPWN